MSENFTQRARLCGNNCPQRKYRKCLLSTVKEGNPDLIVGYNRLIIKECIINYRLKYSLVWDLYLDYQKYTNYADLPLLIAILLQTMENDRHVLNEHLRKEKEEEK